MNIHKLKHNLLVNLNKTLTKHQNLHYIAWCLKHLGNKNYYKELFSNEIYPIRLRLDCNGNENKETNLFHIVIKSPRTGLACYIRYTLLALYSIDKLNFIPVIEYSGESWLKEDKAINGSDNIFEYYFTQPSNFSINDIKNSYHVFSSASRAIIAMASHDLGSEPTESTLAGYSFDDNYLNELGKIYKKYIHLNSVVKDYIRDSLDSLFKGDTNGVLALHIRGTDFALHWDNHPNMITPEQYGEIVDSVFESGKFNRLFVATDDAHCLNWFINRYGNRVIYYNDVYRSTGTTNIAAENINRENSHYLSGLEVLRDMYTLAECDGLLCGLSHVSVCSRIIKRSKDKPYVFERILSNGIYHKSEKKGGDKMNTIHMWGG